MIGPFTPILPLMADLASEAWPRSALSSLMFGVGLHFSPKDRLCAAWAVPVALLQIVFGTALGVALAMALGWGFETGVVLGLALSVSSTVGAAQSALPMHGARQAGRWMAEAVEDCWVVA